MPWSKVKQERREEPWRRGVAILLRGQERASLRR